MLRRKSTKSKQYRPLGRSKSTSCINQYRLVGLHSDPFIGQRDAHIAARLSYQRAHNRKSEGMAVFSRDSSARGLSAGDGQVSRHDFARSESARSQIDDSNNGRLSRQQSVRFTGPGCRQRRTLASRASETRLTPTPTSNYRAPTVDGIERPARSAVSESQDAGFASSSIDPFRLMQTSDNRTNSEVAMTSAPPANRRIRKSKSMLPSFNPANAGYYFSNSPAQLKQDPQTSRYASLNKENAPLAKSDGSGLRAPKSMSFLRSRRENTSSNTGSHAENDLAVQLAREKFREQVEGQSQLKSHPSIFFRSRNRRTDSSFGLRKSLRNSSNNSATLSSAFSGDSLDLPKHGSLRKTARKVSSSIKTTLKGIFGRRTSGTSTSFARGASETHDTDDDSCLRVEPTVFNEEASVSRGPSRIASIQAVPSLYRMKSLRGSLDSCEGDDDAITDDKSRVTSWTDSVANTVASHAGAGDWERQRLSVIKENGLHVSSSGPLSSMTSQDYAIGKAITVDSQRVYSALMKRAHETKQREEEERRRSVDEMRSLGRAPPRSSSVDQFDGQSWSPPTIRCVQSDDDVFQDEAKDIPPAYSGSPQSAPRQTRQGMPSACGSPNPWSEKAISKDTSPGKGSASSRSDLDRARTLTHRSSAFFASPANHLFRTASPFRRALRESMKVEAFPEPAGTTHEWNTEYLGSMSAVSLPTRRPSPIKSETTSRDECADSIYSSMEEDGKPNSSLVAKFPVPTRPESHGDATIFASQTLRPSPRRSDREVSTTSSVEWKTWLSSHVSKLEGNDIGSKSTPWSSPDMFPKLGHVREKAEIESPSEAARSSFETAEVSSENTPLGPIQGNTNLRPTQKPSAPPLRVTAADENEAPSSDEQETGIIAAKQPSSRGNNDFRSPPPFPLPKEKPSTSSLFKDDLSLRQSVSLNTLSQTSSSRTEEVTQRRRARMYTGRETTSSVKSSPGLTTAVEKQFGKTTTGSPAPHTLRMRHVASSPSNPWTEESAWDHTGPTDVDSPAMDSKRMVDSFLQSRRQKMGAHKTNDGSSPAAFV